MFETVVVAKALVSGIIYQHLQFVSLNFVYAVLNFLFLTTSLSTTELSLREQFLIYQHLTHLLLFLNQLNQLDISQFINV